jgi:hypothetical protein
MVDNFVHKNPQDLAKGRFERLEVQVVEISHNMNLLITALARKFRTFEDDGRFNSDIRSEGKLKDREDSEKELWKESEKEQLSSSDIKPSQYLFKMEAKVDINPYQGEIDALKMNNWL